MALLRRLLMTLRPLKISNLRIQIIPPFHGDWPAYGASWLFVESYVISMEVCPYAYLEKTENLCGRRE